MKGKDQTADARTLATWDGILIRISISTQAGAAIWKADVERP